MLKTTAQHAKWWRDRQIDWDKHYTATWSHTHRALILAALQTVPWVSLWEIGCGSGANFIRIIKELPMTELQKKMGARQLGGSDVNADAIAACLKVMPKGKFHVESSEDILLTDSAVDVMLSDASLIYIGPMKIRKVLREMIRVGRNNIILCEFNETSLWKRVWLRLKTGYNAYDYKKLLESEGCFDIKVIKIPEEYWPGFPWGGKDSFGHIIIANIAKL